MTLERDSPNPMTPWFIATKKFTPSDGEAWTKYIEWSGLNQLVEVVSLDPMLCPSVLPHVKNDYWPHIVNENFMLDFFVDFDFLRKEVADIAPKNMLCVFRNPSQVPIAPTLAAFEFLGYDLVDAEGLTSALTNCGGFPDVFANEELSHVGLISRLERAREVQVLLRSRYPEEPHANCHLWAIFRAAD